MANALFNAIFRRKPPSAPNTYIFPYKIEQNPFQSKRVWPPDFTQMSTKHQLRIEKRWKRRILLKNRRPIWMKGTKLIQWGFVTFIFYYGFCVMDFNGDGSTIWKDFTRVFRGEYRPVMGRRVTGVEWNEMERLRESKEEEERFRQET